MNNLNCPTCNKTLEIYIDSLYPMQAVSADMLKQGIIIDCLECRTRINDISTLFCPQCGNNNLVADIDQDVLPSSFGKKVEGSVNCSICEFKLLVSKDGGVLPI
ncbi:MAG: hypothetical protein ACTSQ4_12240 [Candidatus Heimdallarchaeaceae archaeon]